MRVLTVLLALLFALSACPSTEPSADDDDDDDDSAAPELIDTVTAESVTVTYDPRPWQAREAVGGLLAAVGALFNDDDARLLLGGMGTIGDGQWGCVERELENLGLNLDYSACDRLTGTARVEPGDGVGRWRLCFQDGFAVEDLSLTGCVGLVRDGIGGDGWDLEAGGDDTLDADLLVIHSPAWDAGALTLAAQDEPVAELTFGEERSLVVRITGSITMSDLVAAATWFVEVGPLGGEYKFLFPLADCLCPQSGRVQVRNITSGINPRIRIANLLPNPFNVDLWSLLGAPGSPQDAIDAGRSLLQMNLDMLESANPYNDCPAESGPAVGEGFLLVEFTNVDVMLLTIARELIVMEMEEAGEDAERIQAVREGLAENVTLELPRPLLEAALLAATVGPDRPVGNCAMEWAVGAPPQ